MRKILFLVASALVVVLAGCSGSGVTIPTASPSETLLHSSAPQRPDWTLNEPDSVDGVMTFVGMSERHKTEKAARADASKDSRKNVVNYMGTLVKDKWERAATSFGLEGDVIDATAAANSFQKQMSVNMANKVKMKKWYFEKWQTETGIGYQYFALANVPESAIDESYKSTAKSMAKAAERKAKEANDAVAKQQAEKSAEFWKQMQERGVAE